MRNVKTVELTPSWEAALNICIWGFERSYEDIRSARGKSELCERIRVLRETFLPLCRTIDARNEEIRKEAEAKEATKSARDHLDCGHTSADLNADMKCNVCGCDANVPF